MRANESIIAVPITVEQPGQTRQFLVRLVEQLDIVLGNRGGDPYVSSSQLTDGLTVLEKTVLDVLQKLLAAGDLITEELLTALLKQAEETIDGLKSTEVINNANVASQVISGTPTQAEVQALNDQVVANAVTYNTLLEALRGTEIIAT